jgi:capsular polysaccharide biosynthesis protein
MVYTIYLNIRQAQLLREAALTAENEQIKNQLAINMLCSYIFTVFIGLLIIFVSKSFLV